MTIGYSPPFEACKSPSSTMKDRPQEVAFQVRSSSSFQVPCLKSVVSLVMGASGMQAKTTAVRYIVLEGCWTTLTNSSKGGFSCQFYVG